mmetsp:Transcript_33663/g.107501  ORF Transcript_33663/g.107501 Transcript_33663/m.107501 type:complete len:266 (+) Transcript_33663:1434-2231(+)
MAKNKGRNAPRVARQGAAAAAAKVQGRRRRRSPAAGRRPPSRCSFGGVGAVVVGAFVVVVDQGAGQDDVSSKELEAFVEEFFYHDDEASAVDRAHAGVRAGARINGGAADPFAARGWHRHDADGGFSQQEDAHSLCRAVPAPVVRPQERDVALVQPAGERECIGPPRFDVEPRPRGDRQDQVRRLRQPQVVASQVAEQKLPVGGGDEDPVAAPRRGQAEAVEARFGVGGAGRNEQGHVDPGLADGDQRKGKGRARQDPRVGPRGR